MDRIQIGVRLMLLMFVLAFVADAIGNVSLAQLLAGGTLRSAYQVLALAAAVQVTSGLVAYALRSRTLQHLWMVQRHGDLLERRAHTLLRWMGIAAWFLATLESFSLLRPTVTATQTALTAELQRGALSISLGDILAFVFTIWLSFLISSFIRFVLQEDVFPRVRLAPGLPYAVSTVLHYLILFVGFLLGVAALGLDLNKFTVLGGALGVGIGFGLQSVVNNFVSGLIVLFERPVRVGDSVQIGDVWGDVRRIGIRATTLRTYEGAEVLIPNSMLVSERVTNWTLSDRARRADVRVGVAYGTAPERVLELLREVARATPHVAASPAPLAIFVGFGDSALNFELRVWTDRSENWLQLRSELSVAVYAALRAAGIEIPFPQREVRLRDTGHQERADNPR
jgi:small-conductance mechanosensitive channel